MYFTHGKGDLKMPRRSFEDIATEKQEQRVMERPEIEGQEIAEIALKRGRPKKFPPSTPQNFEYSKYSTIAAAYARGDMPKRHSALYRGIRRALGERVREGEVNMGEILEKIDMNRKSAANIIRHLENFGFIAHERRPRGTYVKILK